ncbi:hypothetical protein KR018_004257 [Drosophila ironensis]|nr:hypothetical protein KR018_004257 [Drosophila ironensis]
MELQQIWILLHLTGLMVRPALGKYFPWQKPFEDDFVDVNFDGCIECEKNFRNIVFVLDHSATTEEEEVRSVYPFVVAITWLILAVLVAIQRWRQMKKQKGPLL